MNDNIDNKYFAILGANPSKGARSPKLWNRVLKKLKRNERMIPIDIKKEELVSTLKKLEGDKNFLGGCIAVPYKEKIYKILKKNIPKNKYKFQSINCIFRDKNGKLTGSNTDGLGALHSLRKIKLKKKKILVLGLGGTGKAISSSLKDFDCKNVFLTNRGIKKKFFARTLKYKFLDWQFAINNLQNFDVIINATSAGFQNKHVSPVSEKYLSNIKNKFFFDVIYQPKISKFLSIVKKKNLILNGDEMNLMQAVKAFSIVTKFKNEKKIIKLMMK